MRTTHLPSNPFEQYLDYAEKHPHEFSKKMKLLFEMQKRMLERYDFIEEKGRKACEWIESYLFDIGFPDDWCRDSATMKSGKQRFLEAMEE